MSSSTLFPPPLTLHSAPPAGSSVAEASVDQPPNLMPFSIEYTGPANVDGYLVSHQANAYSSSSSSHQNAHASLSGPLSKSGGEARQEEVYTHFRGRRLWRTTLPLPPGWSGRVCLLQRERPRDAPVGVGVRDGTSQAATTGGAESGAGEVTRRRLEEEEEAEREEMRRKKRRLNAAAAADGSARNAAVAKKPAAMAAFSMDDDEEEEEQEGAGGGAGLSEEEDVYDVREEDVEDPYIDPLHDEDHDKGFPQKGDFLPREDIPTDPLSSRSTAPPLPQAPTTTSLLPSSRFSSIHIWSPDGKLDAGDEELVKVLGEWRSINALLHSA